MSTAYLFIHFREMNTPDGEQVRFSVSLDGFNWDAINDGKPLMWAYYGDKGVRDYTIVHSQLDGKYYILATDLSLAYGMRKHKHNFWEEVSRNGSKCLAVWESDDLVHWSEQRLAKIGTDDFGCLWAPDIIFDKEHGDYVVHFSSAVAADDYKGKSIYYSRTKDFVNFTEPRLLYETPDKAHIIDSAIYEENGKYYMFAKSRGITLLVSDSVTGKYEPVPAFDECMKNTGAYEAPTAVKLDDGRWCLFIDFFGVSGEGQGYVPYVSDDISTGIFKRSDESFKFPFGFKHGSVIRITREEYDRIKAHNWGKIYGW